MDDKRDRTQYPSGEPGSPYSDAYYEKAPETKRSCYGYNVAQCYARASGEPEPPVLCGQAVPRQQVCPQPRARRLLCFPPR